MQPPTVDPNARYAASPDVVYTRLDDEQGVLLHLRTQRYYTLNDTGAAIWELLTEPRGIDDVAAALARSFEVEEAEAADYVRRFVGKLHEDGLVRAQPGS